MMNIFIIDGVASTNKEAISLCGKLLSKNGCVKESFVNCCIEREAAYPTGLPTEVPVAIPHAKSENVLRDGICLLRLAKAVEFARMDDPDKTVATDLVFNLAIRDGNAQLGVLKQLMKIVRNAETLKQFKLLSAEEAKNKLEALIVL
jgi:PTS system galactitol-specific IIA component